MEPVYFVNGEFLSSSKAALRIDDLALLRGFGIFDFFRTFGGKPFLIDHYLERFSNSARLMNLTLPFTKPKIKNIVLELISRNQFTESGIRIVLTGGYTEDGFTPGYPNFFIKLEPLSYPDKINYDSGIKLVSFEHLREWSQIKSINYLTPIKIRGDIALKNGYDVLYRFQGNVLEASRSNFFVVHDGVLATPRQNVLHGITRKTILELSKQMVRVEERDVAFKELAGAEEAFITGTTKRVLPVTCVDNLVIGSGKVGPTTRKLIKIFRDFEKSTLN